MPLVSKYLLKNIIIQNKRKMREALLQVIIDNHTKGRGHPEGEIIIEIDVTLNGQGMVKENLGEIMEIEEMVIEILEGTESDLGQDLDRKRGEGGVDLHSIDLIETGTMIGLDMNRGETIAEIKEAEALAITIGLDMNLREVRKAL